MIIFTRPTLSFFINLEHVDRNVTFLKWDNNISLFSISRMIAVAQMRDLIGMIEERSNRDHEAIPQEPQKRGTQEPQIVMVLTALYFYSHK